MTDILTKGEEIQYVGVQKKPVVTISPDSVILTNKRFIIARPKLTGFKFEDFQWRQVHDVHLSEQMMGATISCTIVGGQKTSIDSIPKKQARRIYSYSQEIEEKMIEERREREMEEKRAAAGGVVFQSPAHSAPAPQATAEDPVEQLGKLKKMLEAGLIDQSEFDAKKTEIMSRL
ncbi:MAG: PH domain-containing protein [Verrucomicrobiota bacterium]